MASHRGVILTAILHTEGDTPELIWTEDLAFGVAAIDRDHRHLFAIARRLQAAIAVDKRNDAVGTALIDLFVYSHTHFEREESHMKDIDYPETETHMREHKILLHKVLSTFWQWQRTPTDLSDDVMAFLKSWLVNHVMNSDKSLSLCIRERGRVSQTDTRPQHDSAKILDGETCLITCL